MSLLLQISQSFPTVGNQNKDMKKNADGGLTVYIQNQSPGKDKESNWLPAPKGPFAMYMRLYWPKEAALDGSWTKPKQLKAK